MGGERGDFGHRRRATESRVYRWANMLDAYKVGRVPFDKQNGGWDESYYRNHDG